MVVWQLSQESVVEMCAAFLPGAVVPLWQVAQPLEMPVWSKRLAGFHVMVEWQAWHSLLVGR